MSDAMAQDEVRRCLRCDVCVGCGLCGEVAHAAVLCPSFYRASIIDNPTKWDHFKQRVRGAVIGYLQRRLDRKMVTV